MPDASPFTWQPKDVVEVTNISGDNLLLELASGLQRLDSGRSIRLTASALAQPPVKALVDRGLIKVAPVRK